MNQLAQLKQYTTVVADTGDFHAMEVFQPHDATTNPSLILKAVQKPEYRPLLDETVRAHQGKPVADIIDHLLVAFGLKILAIIPGRVSTETDARLSFDTDGTIAKASLAGESGESAKPAKRSKPIVSPSMRTKRELSYRPI